MMTNCKAFTSTFPRRARNIKINFIFTTVLLVMFHFIIIKYYYCAYVVDTCVLRSIRDMTSDTRIKFIPVLLIVVSQTNLSVILLCKLKSLFFQIIWRDYLEYITFDLLRLTLHSYTVDTSQLCEYTCLRNRIPVLIHNICINNNYPTNNVSVLRYGPFLLVIRTRRVGIRRRV